MFWLFWVGLIVCVFCFVIFFLQNNYDTFANCCMCAVGAFIFIFVITVSDYYITSSYERDLKVSFENLTKEGSVIENFSKELLVKSNNNISLENNNQASTFIDKKTKWVDLAKKHNENVATMIWNHEQNAFFIYMLKGQIPFKSAQDVEKYKIDIK